MFFFYVVFVKQKKDKRSANHYWGAQGCEAYEVK